MSDVLKMSLTGHCVIVKANVKCCLCALGIERQLESNTDERASADLRIRKSQVKEHAADQLKYMQMWIDVLALSKKVKT